MLLTSERIVDELILVINPDCTIEHANQTLDIVTWRSEQEVETREKGKELMELNGGHVDRPSHNPVVNDSVRGWIHLRLQICKVKLLLKSRPEMETNRCGARLPESPVNIPEPETPDLRCGSPPEILNTDLGLL